MLREYFFSSGQAYYKYPVAQAKKFNTLFKVIYIKNN